jgi:hypothetical protein
MTGSSRSDDPSTATTIASYAYRLNRYIPHRLILLYERHPTLGLITLCPVRTNLRILISSFWTGRIGIQVPGGLVILKPSNETLPEDPNRLRELSSGSGTPVVHPKRLSHSRGRLDISRSLDLDGSAPPAFLFLVGDHPIHVYISSILILMKSQ